MRRPLPHVLESLAREVARLARLSLDLQGQLSLSGYAERDVEVCQLLDVLTQTLTCLPSFIADMGEQVDPGCMIDIEDSLSRMCLTGLAERLRSGKQTLAVASASSIELF